MLNIKIGTTVFEAEGAVEKEELYNGSFRRVLTVTCLPDAIGIDALNAVLTEKNLASIVIADTETGAANIYDGYVLKLACGIQNTLVQRETPTTPALYEDRLIFKVGMRTYIEEQLHKLGL